jgi:hypothetical protein
MSALFKLGQTVITRNALAFFSENELQPLELLAKHQSGDWGLLCKEELKEICSLFVESLETKGFTKAEGIEALGSRAARSGGGASKGTKSNFPRELWGRSFKDPATGHIYTKSKVGKGRVEGWLADLVENGAKYEDFLVKE